MLCFWAEPRMVAGEASPQGGGTRSGFVQPGVRVRCEDGGADGEGHAIHYHGAVSPTAAGPQHVWALRGLTSRSPPQPHVSLVLGEWEAGPKAPRW